MDDKWDLRFERDVLYFHRSWTGLCIYEVRFRRESDGSGIVREAYVSRDAREYDATDDAHDVELLVWLIDVLLLGRARWFPHAPAHVDVARMWRSRPPTAPILDLSVPRRLELIDVRTAVEKHVPTFVATEGVLDARAAEEVAHAHATLETLWPELVGAERDWFSDLRHVLYSMHTDLAERPPTEESWSPEEAERLKPVERSHWVRSGRLLVGEYPGDRDPGRTRERLGRFLDAEVTAFIDLTHPADRLASYADALRELASERGMAVQHEWMPIRTGSLTGRAHRMIAILDAIDSALRRHRRVYVHARGVRGRVALVIGCFLARHARGREDPVAKLRSAFGATAGTAPFAEHGERSASWVRSWPRRDRRRWARRDRDVQD